MSPFYTPGEATRPHSPSASYLQIEDLSQQVHKAAAEKFKVPVEPSPMSTETAPTLTIREESEEEEEVKFADWPVTSCPVL